MPTPPPTNLAALQSSVDDLGGFDLAEPERDRLLHEGYSELCVRSHFSKANLTLVADGDYYTFPATARKILSVKVGTEYAGNVDDETGAAIAAGSISASAPFVWWIHYDADAVRKVAVNPAGVVSALCVVSPAPMEEDEDEPIVPLDFRAAIVDYVAEFAYGREEDDDERRAIHRDLFERAVGRLRMLVNEIENGEGPIQMGVKGIHFA